MRGRCGCWLVRGGRVDGIHGGQAVFGVADRKPAVPDGPLLLVAGDPFGALVVEVVGGGDGVQAG